MKKSKGFTLIELMVAIAIISILAAVAIVAAKDAVAKARVGQTRGNLGTLRATIMVYRTDHLGEQFDRPTFPAAILASSDSVGGYGTGLSDALVPKYINGIPPAFSDSAHGYTNDVCEQWNMTGSCENVGSQYGSGWRYDANPWSETWGSITVACQHKSLYGVSWTTY